MSSLTFGSRSSSAFSLARNFATSTTAATTGPNSLRRPVFGAGAGGGGAGR